MSKKYQEASDWSGMSDEKGKRSTVIEITENENMLGLIDHLRILL